MLIIPAIDLKDERCVRLRQGEMDHETRYSDDPSAMALHWQTLGAQYLHVVDLNGAVEGLPKHIRHIETMMKSLTIPIQVGGGIRTIDTVRQYFSMGVDRIVLGTAALEDADLIAEACEEFPSRVLVGIDVRQKGIAHRGWTNVAGISPDQLLTSLMKYALAGIIFTDITRDGMLTGPNLTALREMVDLSPFPLIASGGVTKITDIQAIKSIRPKINGIIIGKALYEGTLDLKAAILAASFTAFEGTLC